MHKYWTSYNSRLILVATIEVIRSNKGKPKLLFENYAYLIKHQKNYINWYCVKEGISCKGGIKTTNDLDNLVLIKRMREHNHDGNPDEVILKLNIIYYNI